MKKLLRNALGTPLLTALFISMNACDSAWLEQHAYGENKIRGRIEGQPLRVIVISQPLTYGSLAKMETGYEFDLIQHFALDAGYKLKIKTVSSRKEMLKIMKRGGADLAAARFTQPEALQTGQRVGPAYDEDRLSLICHRDTELNFNLLGVLNRNNKFRLGVSPVLMNAQWLSEIKKRSPLLKISAKTPHTTPQFFKQIQNNRLDCTIADRLEAHYYLRFFRNLKLVKDISASRTYHFVVSNQHIDLERQLRVWFTLAARKQVLSQTKAQYQDKSAELSALTIQKFLRDQQSLYPTYAEAFRKHSLEFNVPWQLVAAVAYQESQWNSEAESFTGVKGLMQLTQETAEHLGVEDRTDANQSIWGGSKYLKMLLDRQPKGLPAKERMALALATYNVGPAHMIDAQNLAQRLGKDPLSWRDMKLVLPLLANKDYLEYLKYGPARGHEPVEFVHRVFAYLDLISTKI